MKLTPAQVADFRQIVWEYYHENKRDMPWRANPNPYYVFVSEIMLQQTQVPRVRIKFAEFTQEFPDFGKLAAVPLSAVVRRWNGLGYNRRAKFIWQAANRIVSEHGGILPSTPEQLQTLPGIGPNTAGAIMAYAFNKPVVFIETNIRTVCIHHFFTDTDDVTDMQIKSIVQQTLPDQNVREWYWALMDYGTHLKATVGTYLQRSKQYKKQSIFKGSRREIRGEVLRQLLTSQPTTKQLAKNIPDQRLLDVLLSLVEEGLIEERAGRLYLTDG